MLLKVCYNVLVQVALKNLGYPVMVKSEAWTDSDFHALDIPVHRCSYETLAQIGSLCSVCLMPFQRFAITVRMESDNTAAESLLN